MAGIQCRYYRGRTEFSGPGFRMPVDLHPTAKWNKALAELIVNDLDLRRETCQAKALQ